MTKEPNSVTRQLVIFMCINVSIVAIVALVVISKNPWQQAPGNTNTPNGQVQGAENTDVKLSRFRSKNFGTEFAYPQDWGDARVLTVANACSEKEKTEVVTFTAMDSKVAIEINPCLTGISGFVQNKDQILSNRDNTITFYASVNEGATVSASYTTGADVPLPFTIKLQSSELQKSVEALIYSLQLK